MRNWLIQLETLKDEIEATEIDPAFEANLAPMYPGEEELGTLSPFLQKFHCYIEKQKIVHNSDVMHSDSLEGEAKLLQEYKNAERGAHLMSLIQIFSISLADELAPSKPDIWGKMMYMAIFVTRGWKVVAIPPPPMRNDDGPLVFVAIGNPENVADANSDLDVEFREDTPEDPKPPAKRKPNRKLDS